MAELYKNVLSGQKGRQSIPTTSPNHQDGLKVSRFRQVGVKTGMVVIFVELCQGWVDKQGRSQLKLKIRMEVQEVGSFLAPICL